LLRSADALVGRVELAIGQLLIVEEDGDASGVRAALDRRRPRRR
jgi:hypothetical protein